MKTDSFFYRFFSAFPSAFFALIGEDERKAGGYKFTSIEVKEQAFRFDGVFLPELSEDFIYFVEVQFSRKADFYPRFFGKIFLYLPQYQPTNNWQAIVLFPKETIDPGVHHHYQEFFESGRLRRIYLNQLPKAHLEKFPLNLLQIIVDSKQKAVLTAGKIIRQLPAKIPDAKEQEKIIELVINLMLNKLPKLSREEIQKMVEPLISNIKKTRFYHEVADEERLEEKRKIARAMAKKKMSLELISELTGLSKTEVRAILKATPVRKLAARKSRDGRLHP